VAGWGTLKNTVCHTGDDGPSPNSQCAFPFVHEGIVHHSCSRQANPSEGEELCRQARELFDKDGEKGSIFASARARREMHGGKRQFVQFREQHPTALTDLRAEAVLHNVDEEARNETFTCYAGGAGPGGWCVTCKIAGAEDDPEVCKDTHWAPNKLERADKKW